MRVIGSLEIIIIQFTYERDDAQAHSWIDHILCSCSSSHLVSNAHTLQSGSNLSDHLPLHFNLYVNASASRSPRHPPPPLSSSSSSSSNTLWSKVSATNIEIYCNYLNQHSSTLSTDILSCSDTACLQHNLLLDKYADQLVSTLIACAKQCFPTRSSSSRTLVGWNDSCKDLKHDADFWYKVWKEAGRPLSGTLFDIKKSTKRKYKSSVRRLKHKQNQLTREKLAKSFAERKKAGFWSAIKQIRRTPTPQVPVVDGCADPSEIANLFASNMCGLLNTHSPALRDSMLVSIKSTLSPNQFDGISVSEEEVQEAISHLKNQIALAFPLNI